MKKSEAMAVVNRLRSRHVPFSEWCHYCGELWPCPTIRALDGEAAAS